MGFFAEMKTEEVKPGHSSNYFKEGDHLVRVDQASQKKSDKGHKLVIVSCTVLKTSNENVNKGTSFDVIRNLTTSKFPESTIKEVMDFLRPAYAALCDELEEERESDIDNIVIDGETTDSLTGEDCPLAGVFMHVKVWHKETKAGGKYTKYRWDVAPDLDEARELATSL